MADYKSSEGKVIGGKRMCGKSTELIKQSHETGVRILTANKNMAFILMDQAKRMGLKIKPPLTPGVEFGYFGDVKEVLVDEVEMVLQQLIGKRVSGMSTSYHLEEFPSLRDEPKKRSVGELTVDIDCSDALKGLKAIQREARKATATLKELEGLKSHAIVFDEMHYKCPVCKGTRLGTIHKKVDDEIIDTKHNVCVDCGARQ